MKKTIAAITIVSIFGAVGVSILPATSFACGFFVACSSQSASDQKQHEQQTITDTLTKLTLAEPIPQLSDSLERANISKRLTLFSDPSKISYIYLISFGKVMAFYTVKGKITSGNKRLTAADEVIADPSDNAKSLITDAPELDGTYGTSAPYIFFWTTDGTYVQWSGEYMLADQPLQLTTQPELVRSVK